jgi:hypothetical protein
MRVKTDHMQVSDNLYSRFTNAELQIIYNFDLASQEKFKSNFYSSLTESFPLMLTGAIIPAGARTGC